MSFLQTGRALLLGTALAFVMSASAAQANRHYQVLHSFNGSDGLSPNGDLLLDGADNLYGTTVGGGTFNDGTIYKMSPAGDLTTLYSFTGGSDGRFPETGLTLDPATGDLYGTTDSGGANGYGGVFKYTSAGVLAVLHDFLPSTDGSSPQATLTRDAQGNFYGTTNQDGSLGNGTIFEVTADGGFQVLHTFKASEGGGPIGRLLLHGTDLYGTTTGGGSGSGTIYQLDLGGTFTVLQTPNDGEGMIGGLARDHKGNLYGNYSIGPGFVYVVTPDNTMRPLYTFTGGSDGSYPGGDILLTKKHELYGTTAYGGTGDNGTIFRLDTKGNFTLLHDFAGAPRDGTSPNGGLVRLNGKLYGTSYKGGADDKGIVFAVSTK